MDRYRSNFEKGFARNLEKRNIHFTYEPEQFNYFLKVRKGRCKNCGETEVVEAHTYTPDFKIGNIYIELKGNFIPVNRTKMIAVKKENPDLDIRVIFMFDNRLTKQSRKRYSDWCEENGFKFAFKEFPREWEEEINA